MKARHRVDDTPENIERRIREYRELEVSMQRRYGSANAIRVDGTGTVQQVASAIADQIDNVRSGKGLITRPPDSEGGLKQRPAETSPPPQ